MSKIVLCIYRIALFLKKLKIPFIPLIMNKLFVRLIFGCHIGLGAKIGKGVDLGYGGLGIVIHGRSVIGDNVKIGPGVTIGGTSKKYEVPKIGSNTILGAGAKILGPVAIGQNCVIGANAVVISDIPDSCLAAGIPAKIIRENIDISSYRKLGF